MEFITMKMIEEVIATIRERSSAQPRVGMILGSGLGALANSIEVSDEIPTADLPHWPVSTVEGHAGRLIFGVLEGQNIMVLQGRTHYYEGYSTNQIGLPIRVMKVSALNSCLFPTPRGQSTQILIPAISCVLPIT